MAIESAHYNAPSIVRGIDPPEGAPRQAPTRFDGHIKTYTQTKNLEALRQAVWELIERSNNEKVVAVRVGLQNRRNSEACLLASYESSLFPDVC